MKNFVSDNKLPDIEDNQFVTRQSRVSSAHDVNENTEVHKTTVTDTTHTTTVNETNIVNIVNTTNETNNNENISKKVCLRIT